MQLRSLRERLGKERLYCDGGTGSLLQEKGLRGGELPERWNLTHPEEMVSIAEAYFLAGSDIVNSNTFGANRLHYPDRNELEQLVRLGVRHVKSGRERSGRQDAYVALDLGPTGRLLKPMGDLDFEDCVSIFAELVRWGREEGADLVLIETMSDAMEAKAAVLAAKENSDLPVLVTVVFDEKGKLLTGGTVSTVTAMLEGLRVDALGVNCGLGPEQLYPIVKELTSVCSIPIIVNPNAGLPHVQDGKTAYDLSARDFALQMKKIAELGVQVLGGCCGTTPEYIRQEILETRDLPFVSPGGKHRSVISSFSRTILLGERPVIIGERINPTGKKRFKEALRNGEIEYILGQGIEQEEAGADLLDVNVGLPELNEADMMESVMTRLQTVTALPLQIDTTNREALERALRLYHGKAMINSVNGTEESMETVFPLVAKYGGVVVGLCLDEDGIPEDAEGRIRVAKKILKRAADYGIPPEDVVLDALAMTISTDGGSANVTLEALRRIRDELHGHSILGVSNISFGLPQREVINSFFFALALQSGLSCAIINPNNRTMMAAYRSYLALSGIDAQCMDYISAYAEGKKVFASKTGLSAELSSGQPGGQFAEPSVSQGETNARQEEANAGQGEKLKVSGGGQSGAELSGNTGRESELVSAIRFGMAEKAAQETKKALAGGEAPLAIVNQELVPALNIVGKGFEAGTLFLPQLLMAAEAAKAAFEVIKQAMSGSARKERGSVILATVKGDIHDIGKNIVKVLMENYGYKVYDLGRDVPAEKIVETALEHDVKLIGLSALMTTTVVNMEEAIRLIRIKKPDAKVVVGGAVMTQEYADAIGADFYGKEAMDTVRYADTLFPEET